MCAAKAKTKASNNKFKGYIAANSIESYTGKKRVRRSFGRIDEVAQMPNLIELQRESYERFQQKDIPASEREITGLEEVFASVFPIRDFGDKAEIDFVKYEFEEPKYDVEECQQRGMTYAAPLRVTLRLSVFDVDEETGLRSIRDIKEQDVYMVDMPMMTENGTFVVNGTDRVIVSQMHRSPGVFFDHDGGKGHVSGKYLFSARVIPYRGSWLDLEFDGKDLMYVRIDRRRKLPLTTFLRCLDSAESEKLRAEAMENDEEIDPLMVQGMSNEEMLGNFYDAVVYTKTKKGWKTPFDGERMRGVKMSFDLIDAKTGKVVMEEGTKMTVRKVKKLKEDGLENVIVQEPQLLGRFLAKDIYDMETGLVMFEAGYELEEGDFEKLAEASVDQLEFLAIDYLNVGPYLRNTLMADKCDTREEALIDIYRVMRPGEPPTVDSAQALFDSLFFDAERYDLSPVGRVKMNARLELDAEDQFRILCKADILAIVKYLHGLKDGDGEVDDIDNLGNRRVRSVGELMENQVRIGLLRMERAIRERMSSVEIDTYMPHDLINSKPAQAAVREFFGSSQLSQFMDQTNPLAELTHKRRLSALGPGGLARERAGFAVRDIHPSHYGRICPVETPEGPNAGLIGSLSTYAKVNEYGFIETPYYVVKDGMITEEIHYLSADEEDIFRVGPGDVSVTDDGKIISEQVPIRYKSEFTMSEATKVDYVGVSPIQIVSIGTSLIPFLEHDDANRALMGSNM
ncbi:MAG: DNA-directed RNA polymerase subunit beta, partial [Alphaproteobacteria bacterium]|nr:DNA-directed RNA polymerase subunit beta [Alphaproteobacteria bacterium]